MAASRQPDQRAPGQQHLVIRMSVKSNDRRHAGHARMLNLVSLRCPEPVILSRPDAIMS
jgi:hypothetical protein